MGAPDDARAGADTAEQAVPPMAGPQGARSSSARTDTTQPGPATPELPANPDGGGRHDARAGSVEPASKAAAGARPSVRPATPAGERDAPRKAQTEVKAATPAGERDAPRKAQTEVKAATAAPTATPRPSRPGGARRGGARRGDGAGAGGDRTGALRDTTLDAWSETTKQAADAVPDAEMPGAAAGGAAVEAAGAAAVERRDAAGTDYKKDASANIEPTPEAPAKDSVLDTSEAQTVIAEVQSLASKRLPTQFFSPIGQPPTYPGLTAEDFMSADERATRKGIEDLEAQLADTSLSRTERVELTRQLEQAKAKITAIEAQAEKVMSAGGSAPVHDEGPSKLAPVHPAQADILGDALARAATTIKGRGKRLAKAAAHPIDQGRSADLQELALSKADVIESELRAELDRIGTAAGLSADDIKAKIDEHKAKVEELASGYDKEAVTAATKAQQARSEQQKGEAGEIEGAKKAVDSEIQEAEAAVSGPPDMAAIEAKRDELLGSLERAASAVLAGYRSSLEKRKSELTEAATSQSAAAHGLASRQAAAIRRMYTGDPEKGAVESLETKNWAIDKGKHVDRERARFQHESQVQHAAHVAALNEKLIIARNQIRDWAARQEGRERGFWERLLDMIKDWGRKAIADNEAWQRQQAADSRDAMVEDLETLTELRKLQLDRNSGELTTKLEGLDREQQVLAARYLRGQGVDSIGFVAESLMVRIAKRRRPELTDALRDEVLTWDGMRIARLIRNSTNPTFQPRAIANKVKGAIAGLGTRESKLFKALGMVSGPLERASLEKVYKEMFNISMESDVRDDLSGSEWRRGEALMKGSPSDIAVATIADAVSGLGNRRGSDQGCPAR